VIVSTMVLGEFPRQYLDYVMRDCRALLRPGGQLIIADEVFPESLFGRVIYSVGLGLLWIPSFLLLRRPLFPITDLGGIICSAGFRVRNTLAWPASSFKLIVAENSVA
jgi:hypothetical protein